MKDRLPPPRPPLDSSSRDAAFRARCSRRHPNNVISIASHPRWLHTSDPATVPDLMRALHEALPRLQGSPVFYMSREEATVDHMIEEVDRRLRQTDAPLRLNLLLQQACSERAVLCLRLALLKLVRAGAIQLRSERNCAEILLTLPPAAAV